ncbi:MAG: hypothetical protein ABI435_04220 [Pseudolysinimonas sp.]
MVLTVEQTTAIRRRNTQWRVNPQIPSWVDIESVPLDQFYTRPEIANACYRDLLAYLVADGCDPASFTYLEPSAGRGAFLDLLPPSTRIGLDIESQRADVIETDFLSWDPHPSDMPIVVVGNPPFGYRAWLALQFVNHAATFAEYIGFILPMAFQSDGKGSPKLRVCGMHLVHSETLPPDAFIDGNGRNVKVNALWQIWKRGDQDIQPEPTCDEWIDLFTVDERKERLCGQERMHEADFFLQRTFYRDPPGLVTDFADVKYVCGYGIVIKKDREQVLEILNSTDWHRYSNLAAHNCHHISMYHIRRALTDAGLRDPESA